MTLGRLDDPHDFRGFRVAAITHPPGYGDRSRKAVIRVFLGGIQFWNPGDDVTLQREWLARILAVAQLYLLRKAPRNMASPSTPTLGTPFWHHDRKG